MVFPEFFLYFSKTGSADPYPCIQYIGRDDDVPKKKQTMLRFDAAGVGLSADLYVSGAGCEGGIAFGGRCRQYRAGAGTALSGNGTGRLGRGTGTRS